MSLAVESPFQLADLQNWSFDGTALAVVGHPVAHSLSPAMHNAALETLAGTDPQFASWRYFKFDIAPADLPAALAQFHEARFRGLNLTVPHKSIVIPYLASSDEFVRSAGAANTLRFSPTGWEGINTDGYGLAQALRETLQVKLAGAAVVLLGAGGAARGAAVECLRAGCASLWIGNRTAATLDALATDLSGLPRAHVLRKFDFTAPSADLPAHAIVINATSLGLKVTDSAPIDLARLPRPAAVFDMIYRPAQTALLRQAQALGIRQANGLSMLVHQGARSLEFWTSAKVPVEVMHRAAHEALERARA